MISRRIIISFAFIFSFTFTTVLSAQEDGVESKILTEIREGPSGMLRLSIRTADQSDQPLIADLFNPETYLWRISLLQGSSSLEEALWLMRTLTRAQFSRDFKKYLESQADQFYREGLLSRHDFVAEYKKAYKQELEKLLLIRLREVLTALLTNRYREHLQQDFYAARDFFAENTGDGIAKWASDLNLNFDRGAFDQAEKHLKEFDDCAKKIIAQKDLSSSLADIDKLLRLIEQDWSDLTLVDQAVGGIDMRVSIHLARIPFIQARYQSSIENRKIINMTGYPEHGRPNSFKDITRFISSVQQMSVITKYFKDLLPLPNAYFFSEFRPKNDPREFLFRKLFTSFLNRGLFDKDHRTAFALGVNGKYFRFSYLDFHLSSQDSHQTVLPSERLGTNEEINLDSVKVEIFTKEGPVVVTNLSRFLNVTTLELNYTLDEFEQILRGLYRAYIIQPEPGAGTVSRRGFFESLARRCIKFFK